jgi:hypothetical protein
MAILSTWSTANPASDNGEFRERKNAAAELKGRPSMKRSVLLVAVLASTLLSGCERKHWEEGVQNPVVMGPADLLARVIVGGVLAATEDGSTKKELRLTCHQFGYKPLIGRTERVRLKGFSVEPPSGGNWCLQRQDKNRVSYGTHPWVGKSAKESAPKEALLNTFILAAMRVRTRPGAVAAKGGMLEFSRSWIKNGAEITLEDGEVIADFKTQTRFKLLRHELTERSIGGVDCLDYSYVVAEKDNPIAPGKVFELHATGILCPEPLSPDTLITLNFSERFVRGSQVDDGMFERLDSNSAKPFFDSLKFPADRITGG